MTLHFVVRGYGDGAQIFEDHVSVDDDDLNAIDGLVNSHIERVAVYERHMLEIECLDDPSNPERFFRFGTDMSRMVCPIEIDLSEPS